jgi:hypothetical protein
MNPKPGTSFRDGGRILYLVGMHKEFILFAKSTLVLDLKLS